MPEIDPASQVLGDDAPTQDNPGQSAAPEPDIEALKAEYEKRLKGLQGVVGKKDDLIAKQKEAFDALSARIEELELAAMPEEDRSKHLSKKQAERLAQLERENALLRLRGQHAEGVSLFEQLQAAKSAEEQIALLDTLAKARAQAQAGAKADDDVPDVDENNPARDAGAGADFEGAMSEALADRLLKAHRRMPAAR